MPLRLTATTALAVGLLLLLTACSNAEVEKAQAAAQQAQAEAAKAQAEAEKARAEAEAARTQAEQAQQRAVAAEAAQQAAAEDSETAVARSQAKAAQASANANTALTMAAEERIARLKTEAPKKITASAMGCRCDKGRQAIVTCSVKSEAELAAWVTLAAAAQTGTLKVNSRGTLSKRLPLEPGQIKAVEVPTRFSALADCSSCGDAVCTVTKVEVP
jgi:hypothetical protein